MFSRVCFSTIALVAASLRLLATEPTLRVALFDVDATPPPGSLMAYDPVTNRWDLTLRARGVVLLGAGDPIVLCSIDWIGLANEGHDAFRDGLARAAGTVRSRVALHAVHQHDAPECDFSAERIAREAGLDPRQYEGTFQRQVLADLEKAVREGIPRSQPVTHLGLGSAEVHEVASNRRIFGPDGKVRAVRWTAMPDPAIRAEPEGTIDPVVSLVSFWNDEKPIAVLSYYATHPQSYYRTGMPNPDFPGIARFMRQLAVPAALHIHFNGAGGNIGAGKYNDGSPGTRLLLAERLADGMKRACQSTVKQPITPAEVEWRVESVALPPAKHLTVERLEAELKQRGVAFVSQVGATKLAWVRRCAAGHKIDLSCLALGSARILHMPGELFVEYQLAAKAERPDLFVAMAAYGEYATAYIGTAIAYEQGGYETGPTASNVAPEAEAVLISGICKLLNSEGEIAAPHRPAINRAVPVFRKQVLTDKYYSDGITAGDIDRDGKVDIIAGPFWYKGPDFRNKHKFYPAVEFPKPPSPTDSMFSYTHDFNQDGWLDILVLGRVHLHSAFWYENPKGSSSSYWKKHYVFERVKGESPPFLDVDGDGRPELVTHWENRWGLLQPDWTAPEKEWSFTPITARGQWEQFYHGTGIGDVNGDGRLDLLLNEGWYEQPPGSSTEWIRHEFKFGMKGGAQMFAYDVNGDSRNDVITALDGHGWGLAWFEQVLENGKITFKKHLLMGDRSEESRYGVAFSQPHALAVTDLDGNGVADIIVGKRLWAHGPKGDIEPDGAPVLYWFQQQIDATEAATFVPHRIDSESGVGVQITAVDLNGDGRKDILTVSKLGAFIFLNQ
jgi:hypothetical protein